jgi:hypothetical protein
MFQLAILHVTYLYSLNKIISYFSRAANNKLFVANQKKLPGNLLRHMQIVNHQQQSSARSQGKCPSTKNRNRRFWQDKLFMYRQAGVCPMARTRLQ